MDVSRAPNADRFSSHGISRAPNADRFSSRVRETCWRWGRAHLKGLTRGSAPCSPVKMAAQRPRRGRSPRSMFSSTVSAMSSALCPAGAPHSVCRLPRRVALQHIQQHCVHVMHGTPWQISMSIRAAPRLIFSRGRSPRSVFGSTISGPPPWQVHHAIAVSLAHQLLSGN
jgi:hypothetical protein